VPVTLKLRGSASPAAGDSVTLTATARLAKGTRLLIQGVRLEGGTVKVKECLRSPCTGTWSEVDAEDITFQALVVKRVGRKTTVLGRSKTLGVTWIAPSEPPGPLTPPPPPPPAVTAGHYDGRTSQNEIFAFDVAADSRRITGLHTGQINQSCDPPDYYLSGGYLNNWSGPVAVDGTFTFSYNGPGTVGGNAATYKIVITGKVGAGTASGTIRDDVTWAKDGKTYTCSSGDQTWSATKTA
jgi:hypothetical protein